MFWGKKGVIEYPKELSITPGTRIGVLVQFRRIMQEMKITKKCKYEGKVKSFHPSNLKFLFVIFAHMSSFRG